MEWGRVAAWTAPGARCVALDIGDPCESFSFLLVGAFEGYGWVLWGVTGEFSNELLYSEEGEFSGLCVLGRIVFVVGARMLRSYSLQGGVKLLWERVLPENRYSLQSSHLLVLTQSDRKRIQIFTQEGQVVKSGQGEGICCFLNRGSANEGLLATQGKTLRVLGQEFLESPQEVEGP